MHRAFLVFHRWLALVSSIFVIVVALSGAAIVFEGAIDRAMNPRLSYASVTGPVLPLDTLVARAITAAGGGQALAIGLSPVPGRTYSVAVLKRAPEQGGAQRRAPAPVLQLVMNPYTGEVAGTRTGNEPPTLGRRLHVLHVELMAGPVGRTIVVVICIASLVLALTGLVIWWREKLWRVNTSASWKRINFDLHHALGVFASLVIIVITATGVWVHYGKIDDYVRKLDATPVSTQVPKAPPHEPGAAALTFDSLVAVARATLPGATVMNIQSPGGGNAPAAVSLRFPEDHTPGGRSRLFIDRYRGTVLLKASTREAGLGTSLNNLKRSLHTGDVLGKPTEALWFLAALALAAQGVTGVLMWWNARAGRAAQRARAPGSP